MNSIICGFIGPQEIVHNKFNLRYYTKLPTIRLASMINPDCYRDIESSIRYN